MSAIVLMLCSAGISLVLGTAHLVYTFFGTKLVPRDPALKIRMLEISPYITKETNMWRCWIGFNASHSMGAILFGLIYAYLGFFHSELLFQSAFLLAVGFAMLGGFFILAKLYWFSIPFAGIGISLACYVASIVLFKY